MSTAARSTLALALVLSACQGEMPPIEGVSAPIIGGVPGAVGDFPAVVAIMNGGLCTGTLILPDLVLTAAHCVHPGALQMADQAAVTAQTQVAFDRTMAFMSGGRLVSAAETIPHPEFTVYSNGDNDIGLIRLAEPVTDRPPVPINRIYDDAKPGVVVTDVGYGMTDGAVRSSAGTLYVLRGKKSMSCAGRPGMSDENLLCFSQTDGTGKCAGDSGGPSFATIGGVRRVVGVTSFGDNGCVQFGADTRVDSELSFLFEHAPQLQCQADGACNDDCGTGDLPADPDCHPCSVDTDCDRDDDICVLGQCIPAPFTPGGLGAECTGAGDCDSGRCATGADGSLCTDFCTPEAGDCPDEFECRPAGDQHVCWPTSGSGGGGGCRVATTHDARVGTVVSWMLIGLGWLLARRRRA